MNHGQVMMGNNLRIKTDTPLKKLTKNAITPSI